MEAAAASSARARKEWRAVSDGSYRNTAGSEESERGNMVQSDERTIYEVQQEGRETEFHAIAVEGIAGLSDEMIQQRLQTVMRQREELQGFEIELRAQAISRPQIVEVEAQLKEQISVATKLKEQLVEREKYIREIEKKLEDKDTEVRALQIDNETGWPKDDLLREQNKELATFRRERDNSEAERAQHMNQIRDLQELIREKESQLLSLEEQHRVAQESMIFKEEQLREAHNWISRVQEMDALNNTTNQTLQNELRERTEQFYQYWMGLQRQYAEMERHHMQTIQQLQLELAAYKDGTTENASDQNKPNHNNTNINNKNNNNLIPNGINGNLESSKKGESVPVQQQQVQQAPIIGVGPAYIPSAQHLAYMLHASQGIPAQTSTIQVGSFQPIPALLQAVPDIGQMANIQNQVNLPKPSEKSQVIGQNNTQALIQKETLNLNYTSVTEHNAILQAGGIPSSQIQDLNNNNINNNNNNSSTETDKNAMNYSEMQNNSIKGKNEIPIPIPIPLLDERSILACIVRAIPPGPANQIKISSNLPNRLAKMLAPLTWHDYIKHYGKLDDFVSRHPELFIIEGDFIRIREGAQQIIAATTAAARVAASSYSSPFLPPVAVTPIARHKRAVDPHLAYVTNGLADVRLTSSNTNINSAVSNNGGVRQPAFASKQIARASGAASVGRR
ncbi:hypothetical protein LUZ60_011763 [Juncus effusus]|nr:hypothetical protein LUZ60_011763 [Juncus effusus]